LISVSQALNRRNPMQDVLARGLAVLEAHEAWAGAALGIGACFEALVVVGAFMPLTPLLVMVGAGIGAGVFSPWVLTWTMAGCGVGNWISYEAGLRSRRADAGSAWIPEQARIRADTLFNRYGAMAVVVGRFLGPTASVAPFLAGWTAMPRRSFLLANVATSLAWPGSMAALGFLGARSFAG
jgi:membrane protein DedA with SNARE-associated domain